MKPEKTSVKLRDTKEKLALIINLQHPREEKFSKWHFN